MIATKKKTKVTLLIPEKLNQRLDFQAAVDGKGSDRSSILEALIEAHISLPHSTSDLLDGCPETSEPAEAKPGGRQPTRDATRSKTTFYLTPKTASRLKIHADWTGEDRSSTAERLIREHITPWDVYDPREKFLSSRRSDRRSVVDQLSATVADLN